MADPAPLAGCTVVVTRDEPGELGRLLDRAGATVVHVPLIGIEEPDDDGEALRRELDRLHSYDWLIVTSTAGADRVGAAARETSVRLGAVGTATAGRLASTTGREVDLVPDRQVAFSLADEFVERHRDGPQRVLLALADRAGPTLEDELRRAGHDVERVTAYRTVLRRPPADELGRIARSDAVLFASGSAAQSWADTLGPQRLPGIVLAIGPTTAEVALGSGLKITSVAADHSLPGIVNELVERWHEARAR